LLPWESEAEFQELRTEIFNDLRPEGKTQSMWVDKIVVNRWEQQRQGRTTAIATHRHPFGRALEEANAKSWRQALAIARERNVENENTLRTIAASEDKIAKTAAQWCETAEETSELARFARTIMDQINRNAKRLCAIQSALDAEREFFFEYSPKHLANRIRLENSLDAQYDKLRARLVIEQEAAALLEKLGKTRGNAGNSPVAPDNVEDGVSTDKQPVSDDTLVTLPTDELDRDDRDDWGDPKKPDDDDPLSEFVAEGTP